VAVSSAGKVGISGGVLVAIACGVSVAVAAGVFEARGVTVGRPGISVEVANGVGVANGVSVEVGVLVGIGVPGVGVLDGVFVGVVVGVRVTVRVGGTGRVRADVGWPGIVVPSAACRSSICEADRVASDVGVGSFSLESSPAGDRSQPTKSNSEKKAINSMESWARPAWAGLCDSKLGM
jgi:hypothetical protein